MFRPLKKETSGGGITICDDVEFFNHQERKPVENAGSKSLSWLLAARELLIEEGISLDLSELPCP